MIGKRLIVLKHSIKVKTENQYKLAYNGIQSLEDDTILILMLMYILLLLYNFWLIAYWRNH